MNTSNKENQENNSVYSWIKSALILITIWAGVLIALYNLSMQNASEQGRKDAYNDMYSSSEECSYEVLHW